MERQKVNVRFVRGLTKVCVLQAERVNMITSALNVANLGMELTFVIKGYNHQHQV